MVACELTDTLLLSVGAYTQPISLPIFPISLPRVAYKSNPKLTYTHTLIQLHNHNQNQNQNNPTKPTKMSLSFAHLLLVLSLLLTKFPSFTSSSHDYQDALSKAILFFEGQRSGALPQDQRINWRANSGLSDGWMYNTDLAGGYYDAGDNVKFGFPMAFTTTLLSWSVIEFGDSMPPNELRNAMVAIRWATDYLLKTVSQPNRIFVQVFMYIACL